MAKITWKKIGHKVYRKRLDGFADAYLVGADYIGVWQWLIFLNKKTVQGYGFGFADSRKAADADITKTWAISRSQPNDH